MRRQSRQIIKAVASVKENVNGFIEENGEIYSVPVPKDKTVRMDESKNTVVSEIENVNDKSPTCMQKPEGKCNRYIGRKLCPNIKDDSKLTDNETLSVKLKGNLLETSLSYLTADKLQSSFSEGKPTFLSDASYLTPNKVETDVKPDCGSEKLMKTSIDFASVTIAEFGITPESFTAKASVGKPMALKLRRRSTIGVRGSPENNSLIQYLAEQRMNRTQGTFKKASPFKHQNVGSLKDKISAFQSSFQSVQEDEGRSHLPGPSQEEGESQVAGYSQNKPPSIEQHEQSQLSEELISERRSVACKENLKEILNDSDKTAAGVQGISCISPNVTECGSLSSDVFPVLGFPKTPCSFSPECIHEEVGSNTRSQLSRKKVTFAEELSLEVFDETMPPITPLQKRNLPSCEPTLKSSSCLRSVLKKTPVKLLTESVKEHTSNTTNMEENEPLVFLSLSKSCEEWHEGSSSTKTIDKTDVYSYEKPLKRKKITFGENLSPEEFDKMLPANTPLRKGATPVSKPGPQSDSLSPLSPTEKPLSQPNFDCGDDDDDDASCITALPADLPLGVSSVIISEEFLKPLQESVAIQGNMKEINSINNRSSCTRITRSSIKRKYISISEETGLGTSTGIMTTNAQDIKNIRKNKAQRGKNVNKSPPKKLPKVKRRGYGGKRGRKKIEKSLYSVREVASKKPLLSPIPEIPEVFSSAPSSPSTPKKHTLIFSDYSKSGNACIGSRKEVIEQKNMLGRLKRKVPISNKCPSAKELETIESSSTSGMECQLSNNGSDLASAINTEVLNRHENIQTENELGSSIMSLSDKESAVCVSNQISGLDNSNKTSYQQSVPSLMREHTSPVIVKSNSLSSLPNTVMQENKSMSPFDTCDTKGHKKGRDVIENEHVLESDHASDDTGVPKKLEFFNLQDVGVNGSTQTEYPVAEFTREQTRDSGTNVNVRNLSRKGRRSTVSLSGTENWYSEALGNNLSGSFSNEQEAQVENGSQMFRELHYSIEQSFMRVSEDGEKKVRRSMRLHKNAGNEGLAWIKIPVDIHKNSLSDSACKSRRPMHTSIFRESENINQRQEKWIQCSALGKKNNDSVPVMRGPCKTRRRRSMCASTSQETNNTTQTLKTRRASLVYSDTTYQKESEVEAPFEKSHPTA
ncbi:cell division cycle-associated protein 2 isoform X2 [Carettochelys insculpta]|uniref:cell division cycle-associated protein 2 isoform X2 n=1 Tax=Carettochelys insculpta TaxID=44489 RepID=UPI003EB9F470